MTQVSGNKLMLGLKDPDEDFYCDYEPKAVKQKKKKPKALKRESLKTLMPNTEEFANLQTHNSLADEQFAKPPERESELVEDTNGLILLDSNNRNEDNSKAFIGSLGSWINDFFNNQNKRPRTSPSKVLPSKAQILTVNEDPEYFKSINELKEQFKKKLETETSVHIASTDKLLELNFEMSGNEKKGKKKSKPAPAFDEFKAISTEINELNSIYPQTISKQDIKTNRCNSVTVLTDMCPNASKKLLDSACNDTFGLNALKLDKKKKKNDVKRPDEDNLENYEFPTLTDLSKKLLSNLADQEKCSQLYKNAHLVPDAQHCGTRKTKSYQNSARCYTTNANVRRSNSKVYLSLNSKCKSSHYYSTKTVDAQSKKKCREMPRKTLSELIRDSSTYIRPKSNKPAAVPQGTVPKPEIKASSDELVKHLMKKIKMNHRPHVVKKKSNCLEIAPNNRNRFMQSATNSLVLSVLAKKENENSLLPIKGTRSGEIKYFKPDFIKNTFPSRDAYVRYPDSKLEFRRTKNLQKINVDTYLSEDFNKPSSTEENAPENPNVNKFKRPLEDLSKKDNGEKFSKRQEVKNMLSKIDVKHNAFQVMKVKEKDNKKKLAKNFADSYKESRESQSPRFQKQHELFKIKTSDQNPGENYEEMEKELETASSATALSTHLAVVDTNLQVIPDATVEDKRVEAEFEEAKKHFPVNNQMIEYPEETDLVKECLNVEKKVASNRPEKSRSERFFPHKDKYSRTRTMQYAKESDTKNLLNSFSNNEPPSSKDVKSYEPVLCTSDFRSLKVSDSSVLHRRFSTSSLSRLSKKDYSSTRQQFKHAAKYASNDCNKKNTSKGGDCNKKENQKNPCNKKEIKGKAQDCGKQEKNKGPDCGKQEKNKGPDCGKQEKGKGVDCGFEKMKKPGPSCQ